MLGKLKNKDLIGQIGAYTLTNLINAGIPFFLLPVLTTYLSAEDYGILTNFNHLGLLFAAIVSVSLPNLISRFFFKEDVDFPTLLSTSMITCVGFFLMLSGITFLIAPWVSKLTSIPPFYILFVPVFALSHTVVEGALALLRMQKKSIGFALIRILKTALEISFSLYLIIVMEWGWIGRFTGIISVTAIFGIISGIILIKNAGFKFRFRNIHFKSFIKFGVPLIPHSLSGILLVFADKLIITDLLGVDQNGIYSAAFQIGMAISLLQTSFNQAWVPYFFGQMKSGFCKNKMVKVTYLYSLGLLILAASLAVVAPYLFQFLGKEFRAGIDVVALVGLGFAFNGMYKMMVNYLFYLEKTGIIGLLTLTTTCTNVLLNFLLIPQYGIYGAGLASAIALFSQFIIVWIVSARLYPMPWFSFWRA